MKPTSQAIQENLTAIHTAQTAFPASKNDQRIKQALAHNIRTTSEVKPWGQGPIQKRQLQSVARTWDSYRPSESTSLYKAWNLLHSLLPMQNAANKILLTKTPLPAKRMNLTKQKIQPHMRLPPPPPPLQCPKMSITLASQKMKH